MYVPAFELKHFGRFDSRIVIPAAASTDSRTVTKYEIEVFVADQPGICYIDGNRYALTRGTVLCAKPGQQRHSILPFQCHFFYLTTEDSTLIRSLNALPNCMYTENPEALLEIFQDPDASNKANPNRGLLRHGYMCKILHRLLQIYSSMVSADTSYSQPHRAALLRTSKYIRDHLGDQLSLEELAAVANLSPNYFHRLFTALFGCTPNRYITDQRIQAARVRLAYTDQSLAQIAMDCGFSSQSYFTRRFSRETGKSPLQYRKEMQGRIVP